MPIYEYVCNKGHEFEVTQGINDDPLTRCQVDGCRAGVRRLLSVGGFALKGGGWYADGYGKGNGKAKGSNGSNGCGSGNGNGCACAANKKG
ncbi:MAG: zinc ribbon domain-containing protein [Nitrospirae bacterium]|nr:MAG: zinc ribbon domain-containing protein [Nitrospirota bacterium]